MNDNGTIIHATDSGPYTINPDCTGTLYTNGGTRTVEILLVDSGNEFYSIRTDPANLVFLFHSAKKIFPGDGQSHAQSSPTAEKPQGARHAPLTMQGTTLL